MTQVICSKIELETPPFLTAIQFYSNINEKCVGKNQQEISTCPTIGNILTNLRGTSLNQNGNARRYD